MVARLYRRKIVAHHIAARFVSVGEDLQHKATDIEMHSLEMHSL
jgi:hypothetical protein